MLLWSYESEVMASQRLLLASLFPADAEKLFGPTPALSPFPSSFLPSFFPKGKNCQHDGMIRKVFDSGQIGSLPWTTSTLNYNDIVVSPDSALKAWWVGRVHTFGICGWDAPLFWGSVDYQRRRDSVQNEESEAWKGMCHEGSKNRASLQFYRCFDDERKENHEEVDKDDHVLLRHCRQKLEWKTGVQHFSN